MSMSDVGYNVQKLKGKISLSGELGDKVPE